MKKVFIFSAFLILFQNCTSFKTFDLKTQEIVNNRKYKIAKREKFSKVKIISVLDSIVHYTINGLPQQIHFRDIREIKSKETDVAKVVAVAVLTIGVLSIIAGSQIDYKFKIMRDNPNAIP